LQSLEIFIANLGVFLKKQAFIYLFERLRTSMHKGYEKIPNLPALGKPLVLHSIVLGQARCLYRLLESW
jgi:hypothetical protein